MSTERRRVRTHVAAVVLLACSLQAQTVRSLRLYSEFQRVDPFGEILPVDRAASPREILSPAVARNSFFSVHVVVTAEAHASYFLAIQSYPANVFQWKLYKESFAKKGNSWIPDALVERRYPYFEVMPEPALNIAGQTSQLYLLDIWVPPETPSGTARLEVLVK